MSFEIEDIGVYHPIINFAYSKEKTAAQLRKLADQIEKTYRSTDPNVDIEYAALQEIKTEHTVYREDYSMTTISIKFVTRKRPPFKSPENQEQ